jgi:BCD family chlorophyll transporter-like MFS transporter
MQDVLLEPYGGQVLQLSVSSTTRLTATLALGGLIGFSLASRVLGRGADQFRIAGQGAWVGVPAFLAVILASPLGSPWLFALGVLAIGFGGGLSPWHAHRDDEPGPREQTGLALEPGARWPPLPAAVAWWLIRDLASVAVALQVATWWSTAWGASAAGHAGGHVALAAARAGWRA